MSQLPRDAFRAGAPRLAIAVPCHNEQEVLRHTAQALLARLASLQAEGLAADTSFVCFVDDGSTDGTWQLIRELHAADPRVQGIRLTRNFGHQAAVSAGLEHASGSAVTILDADLQDPPESIGPLIAKLQEGFDVVYAVRTRRKEGPAKRAAYFLYYRLLPPAPAAEPVYETAPPTSGT